MTILLDVFQNAQLNTTLQMEAVPILKVPSRLYVFDYLNLETVERCVKHTRGSVT